MFSSWFLCFLLLLFDVRSCCSRGLRGLHVLELTSKIAKIFDDEKHVSSCLLLVAMMRAVEKDWGVNQVDK